MKGLKNSFLDTDCMGHFHQSFFLQGDFKKLDHMYSVVLTEGQPDAKIREGKSYLHTTHGSCHLLYELK